MIVVSLPRFDHHHNGFGVSSSQPRISWSYAWGPNMERYEWQQFAYDISIDSKIYHIHGSDSSLQPWPGNALSSRERVGVQVRGYGGPEGTEPDKWSVTDWSPCSYVEAALLRKSDWQATLISTQISHRAVDGSLRPICFRKVFELPADTIRTARLYMTSLGVYEVKINGALAGDHSLPPGWTSYNHRLHCQVYDVKGILVSGTKNVIGVEIGPGWFASALGWTGGRRFRYGNQLGLMLQLEIVSDNSSFIVTSDESWRYTFSSLTTAEVYNGEVRDNSLADLMANWNSSTVFNDNRWHQVRGDHFPAAKLVFPDSAPVRVTQKIFPIALFQSKSGRLILDFGQNLVGRLRIPVLSQKPGQVVSFQHAEVMEDGELGIRPLRSALNKDSIVFGTSQLIDWYPKFTFHGFRYVQVDGWTKSDKIPLTIDKIFAEVLHTDFERTGYFSCEHEKINQLHENAIWSMRGNFLSLPTDCPQRDERLGWTGDIQVFAPSAAFLYNVTGMLNHWLEDFAAEQAEPGRGGIPPLVVPSVIEIDQPGDGWWPRVPQAIWADAAILVPWALYQASGDVEILRRQYCSMRMWLEKGITRGPDGLWDENVWQLGDWLDPHASPDNPGDGQTDGTLVADCYLVYVTGILLEISSILLVDFPSMENYRNQYLRLKRTFQEKYVTPQGLVLADTQTALSLAIVFDLLEDEKQMKTAGQRLARLVQKSQFRVSTGFAGTPIICHALTASSHSNLAYRMIQNKAAPSWMYPIEKGATTMWERWDSMLPDGSINPGEMTSFNHYALGSVVHWLHEYVGGISPLQPGWRKIKVEPIPGGTVRRAQVSYKSPYGHIECTWSLEHQLFHLDLVVPPGCKAWVILPGDRGRSKSYEAVPARWVSSGHHTFECECTLEPWPPQSIIAPFWDHTQPEWL